MTERKVPEHEVGSGNVFADVGLPNAAEHMLKAQIAGEIHRLIKGRNLTQTKAAVLMGITQPEVSRLLRGYLREYSVGRLLQFLTAFERDVDIVIRQHDRDGARGQVSVKAA